MNLAESVRRMLELAKQGPQPFEVLATLVNAVYGEAVAAGESDIARSVSEEGEGGTVRLALGGQLARWDAETNAAWIATTPRNSAERRNLIYELMKLSPNTRSVFDDRIPRYDAEPPTVIQAANWIPGTSRNDGPNEASTGTPCPDSCASSSVGQSTASSVWTRRRRRLSNVSGTRQRLRRTNQRVS